MPAVYFLRDAPEGPGLPGLLHTGGPPPLYIPPTDPTTYPGGPLPYAQDVAANASKQSAQSRIVMPGQDVLLPVQFVTANATDNTGRIWGLVPVFLVLPKTPAVQNANLTIELVALEGAVPPLYVGGTATVLASGEVVVDGGNGTMPEPATFIPPNATDPQQAAGYVAGQLVVYGITKLMEGYYLVYLDDEEKDFIVDAEVPEGALLALRLRLVQGSSPVPFPFAAGQPVVYNTSLTPDLIVVPWYTPDLPEPTEPTTGKPPSPPSRPSSPPSPGAGPDEQGDKNKGSSGIGFVPLVLGLGLLGVALRRRR